MSVRKDLTGQRFGIQTVLSYAGCAGGAYFWAVRCDCGTQREVRGSYLLNGSTRSCGCDRGTHGENNSNSPEYRTWTGLKSRARRTGIIVHERWDSYEAFLADMGRKPGAEYSIDRIDNSKGYEPGNCRWATVIEQGRNKTSNRLITHKGLTLCLVAWADLIDILPSTLDCRIRRGWSEERALTTTVVPRKQAAKTNARASSHVNYSIWCGVKSRCHNSTDPYFPDYGGRGIQMNPEWLANFEKFSCDMGPRPSKQHSLERIDNNGNYCKENCCWATMVEQNRNKRSNHNITYNGVTQCVTAWAQETGLKRTTIQARLRSGWSVQRALTELPHRRAGSLHK